MAEVLFVGLLPPVFLQDEVEELDPRDKQFASVLAVICLIVPIVVVPTMTSTVVSEWADRGADAQAFRLRLLEQFPIDFIALQSRGIQESV